MGLRKLALSAVMGSLALAPVAASAESKFSAHVFGDYFYFVDHHDSVLVDQNGFWFRRVNLNWDGKMDETFSARLRLEAASSGDFEGDPTTMVTFVKDAWIRWKKDQHSVYLGLTNSVSHSFVEDFWGYRHLEKIPGEVLGFYSSRDAGIGAAGKFGEAGRVGYHVMVGNGSGTSHETNSGKKVAGAVQVHLTSALVAEAYGDFEDRPEDTDRMTVRGFLGYKAERARAGVEYTQQTRDRSDGTSFDLKIVSGFVTGRVGEKVWLLGRVDRSMEPGASNPGRPYIPMDASVASTFVLAGVEFVARENITFTPNVEAVVYDEPDGGGEAPADDIVGRLTFNFKY